jgi:DNA polymerase III subunit gamma/tau
VDRGYLVDILRALSRADGAAMVEQAERMAARSLSFDSALEELATLLHRLALIQTLPGSLAEDDPDRETLLELAAAFTPEDVQLMYQIALHGRRDLGLAPEEFAGFSITLLRMLAFVPVSDEGTRPAPPARAATQRTASRPAASGNTSGAAAAGKTAVTAIADWRELIAQLKLGGMARMLAEHCELQEFRDGRLDLAVPEAHRHLVEKAYTDKLQAALEERLGMKLKLQITIGGSGNTPVAIEDREKQKNLERAVAAIDADPFVRDLVENFDARVVDSSIKPIE